ncbi:MAG: hypothetical protein ABF824_04210 [Acetobacter sp.]
MTGAVDSTFPDAVGDGDPLAASCAYTETGQVRQVASHNAKENLIRTLYSRSAMPHVKNQNRSKAHTVMLKHFGRLTVCACPCHR